MSAHHSEQDESYFVSMTDLMVGMLFVFIIMLMAFALNLQTATAKLTQTDTARAEMLRDIAESLKKKGIPVVVLPESGVLRLPEKVLFDTGSFDLQDDGVWAIQKLSEALRETLPCYAGTETPQSCGTRAFGRLESVFIEGHTDNQAIAGNPDGNWQLSTKRAITVYRALTATNALLGELRNDKDGQYGVGDKLVGVSGYADQRPANMKDDEAARRENRRIDLRFIMAIPNTERQAQISTALNPGLPKP